MKELRLTGRKSNILLRTMGQERSVSTHVFTELEISGLNENNFVDLPQVFSQKEIPVKKETFRNRRMLRNGSTLMRCIFLRLMQALAY